MSTPIKITTPGVYLQATTSPGDRVALPDRGAGAQILVYNDSAALAFVAFGDGAVTASGGTLAPDIPVPPGALLTLTRPPVATHVSAVTNASIADLYFAAGEGN
jgi:hypothetical protein